MGLLKTNKVADLKKESEGCFNIFKQTVSNLSNVNTKIEAEMITRNEQLAKIQAEQAELQMTKESNTRLIGKIEDFLA